MHNATIHRRLHVRAIRYEASGEPVFSVACHCRACQYAAGGGPSYAVVLPKASVTILKGAPRAYWSQADSGNRVARAFCPDCGTPLFAENAANPEFVAIKPGSLDDSSGFRPFGHIWTSAAPRWHAFDPDLPKWEKNPSRPSA